MKEDNIVNVKNKHLILKYQPINLLVGSSSSLHTMTEGLGQICIFNFKQEQCSSNDVKFKHISHNNVCEQQNVHFSTFVIEE